MKHYIIPKQNTCMSHDGAGRDCLGVSSLACMPASHSQAVWNKSKSTSLIPRLFGTRVSPLVSFPGCLEQKYIL